MKKIITTIMLLALPILTFKASAQGDVIRTGTIETINENGSGTLRDSNTGEIVFYFTRNGEFHRDANGKLVININIGDEVSYLAIQDESKGFSSLIR
jgi:flagellar hook protein FlgE